VKSRGQAVWIKFGLHLARAGSHAPGPVFHRWYPKGEQDSIHLDAGHPKTEMKVWLDLVVPSGLASFALETDTNPEDQGAIECGPLRGLLKIRDVDERTVSVLKEFDVEAFLEEASKREPDFSDLTAGVPPDYVEFAKRVSRDLIFPAVNALVEKLRVEYGQYWLQQPRSWDSRDESLSSYCAHFRLMWGLSAEGPWHKLRPGLPTSMGHIEMAAKSRFREFLEEADWRQIQQEPTFAEDSSVVAQVAMNARQLLDEGQTRYALVECATALEIAVQGFLRREAEGQEELVQLVRDRSREPRPWQLFAVTAGRVPNDDITAACRAIKMRNDLVHDGVDPGDSARSACEGALSVVQALVKPTVRKLPSLSVGNLITPSW